VLAYIQQLPQKKISLTKLAAKAFLPESRFIHLFTEQVGIPPRRYLLWTRLIDAVRTAIHEDNFTRGNRILRLRRKLCHFFAHELCCCGGDLPSLTSHLRLPESLL